MSAYVILSTDWRYNDMLLSNCHQYVRLLLAKSEPLDAECVASTRMHTAVSRHSVPMHIICIRVMPSWSF